MHRVLVVDDDRDSAQVLAELLRTMQHEATYVCDPTEAVPLAKSFQPSIALIDITMPKMDGYAVARVFRSAQELGAVRLVALTGRGEPADHVLSRKAGFDAHVTKPPDMSLLESILAQFDS